MMCMRSILSIDIDDEYTQELLKHIIELWVHVRGFGWKITKWQQEVRSKEVNR